jgi:hydroxymethylpyrimidine/phosphomethylpyrimidine kinase
MAKLKRLPIALTIAGSDSGGGAGIQADLKTFAALGVHGTSVIACLTAQNPERILSVQPSNIRFLRQQLEAVFSELPPAAMKTGMLYSAQIVRAVVNFLRQQQARPPLVVDPVMRSGRGDRLLAGTALQLLKDQLLPLAALVTPNLGEAEILAGFPLRSVEEMRRGARVIVQRYGCPALVKGGHLRNSTEAADILNDDQNEWLLTAPFTIGIRTHGTGCSYSAAITAYLARGHRLAQAVMLAKEYISQAIAQSQLVAGHRVLNHFWRRNLRR